MCKDRAEDLYRQGFLGAFSMLLAKVQDEEVLAETAWCLVCMSTNPNYTESIIKLDIHKQIINLLKSGVTMSQEAFMIILGNVMADEASFQDKSLVADLMNYLKKLLERSIIPASFLKVVSWLMSRLSCVNTSLESVLLLK
eukprot:TRINITY_DN3313_c0_g5_i2.p3 TRINITY_DN3313_c0_g5~~TRINITY_DN3313_c0_g5_i2.p3  ORF type:complete len:141 (-),score=23.53 TRINITY_DN3313_c0_g5_i2:930-1352(-)